MIELTEHQLIKLIHDGYVTHDTNTVKLPSNYAEIIETEYCE